MEILFENIELGFCASKLDFECDDLIERVSKMKCCCVFGLKLFFGEVKGSGLGFWGAELNRATGGNGGMKLWKVVVGE